ncbi:hypothetical protein UlMin_014286 [Ulmus minor]
MDTKANPRVRLIILSLFLYLKILICLGADTIFENQSLSGDQTLVSAGGKFVLGFFKPGNSSRYYIGMWYNYPYVSQQTIVWVANRERSVSNTFSSELRISDGNLVLFDELKNQVWSTNVSSTSPSAQAVLLDTGNLVLNDGSSNSSQPLWQSFDHPAHTWMPGSKIGLNKKTNETQFLTSWKNPEDPASGIYSLQLDLSDNSFIMLWNRSKNYWTSGSWDGEFFSLASQMWPSSIYNFSYVSNERESYFTYTVSKNSNLVPRFVMDVSGQIKQLNWESASGWNLNWSEPRRQCEVYSFSGAYDNCNDNTLPKSESDWDLDDNSGGSFRLSKLECSGNGFLKMLGMSLPDNELSAPVGSAEECQSTCLRNCSCTAYTYDSSGCFIWVGDLLNLHQLPSDDSNGKNIFIRLAASELHNRENGVAQKHRVLLGIVGAAIAILCFACSVYYLRRKKLANRRVGLHDIERHIKDFIDLDQFREDDKKGIDVPFVVLDSIRAATDDFSEANKLGRGGFGPVYKGKFPGGKEIAIKRLSSCSGQGLKEFKNEVLLIAKLQHRNLVRLLGYCVEGDEKMLLYEYMPNKSLDLFLFDGAVLLDWKTKFNIILGIARGLVYLHHDSRLRIIHRDLKTSNILLDKDMNPKISDFGLARIFEGKQTEASTRRVVGTYGYMSPEYAIEGFFSIKSDVFSFGVVVLEIISGKRNTGFYQSEEALSLLGYVSITAICIFQFVSSIYENLNGLCNGFQAWKLWKENRALELMEATLHETCNENTFLKCFNLGLLCVQEEPSDRPTMSDVVVMLGSETAILPMPKKPAFVLRRSLYSAAARSHSRPLSVNEITTSLEQGR